MNMKSESTYTVTFAKSERSGEGQWDDEQLLHWGELSTTLANHSPGRKEGPCFIGGKLSHPRRKAENIEYISLIILDSDGGSSIDDLSFTLSVLHGIKCILSSTYNHLKTKTKFNSNEFKKSRVTPEQWLIEKKVMIPSVAEGAEVFSEDERTTTISHQPCPRVRIIIPLSEPLKRSAFSSLSEFKIAYAQIVLRLIQSLEIPGIDMGSAEIERLYYLPRCPKKGPRPEASVIEGDPLRINELPPLANDPVLIREDAVDSDFGLGGNAQNSSSIGGVIASFNQWFSVVEVLERYGYERDRKNRYLYPGSITGMAGVVLLREGNVAFSHHSNDPLADGHIHDSFDCFRILQYSGSFSDAISEAQNIIAVRAIEEMNVRHAFTTIGKYAVIINEKDERDDSGMMYDLLSPNAFREKYANLKVPVTFEKKTKMLSVGKLWIGSPERRDVKGLTFSPSGNRDGYYNVYQGLAIKPATKYQTGAWDHYRRHIEEIVLRGNQEFITYFWSFFSHLFQKPEEKPGVALVLVGGRGVGKGVILEPFRRILGYHYVQVSHREHVTGRFNGHLENKLLCFIDEGFWSGDHQAESILKTRITEPFDTIERKGIDAVTMPSYTRYIIASNNSWVVPAGVDERRFFAIRVLNERAQDPKYFKPIYDEMYNGGDAHLLRYLLDYNIPDINIRRAPNTNELIFQKIQTLGSEASFWYDALQEGSILDREYLSFGSVDEKSVDWDTDPIFVTTKNIHDAYLTYCKNSGIRFPSRRGVFIKNLVLNNGPCPAATAHRPRRAENRGRGYLFPPLPECRGLFEIFIQAVDKIKW